MNDREIELAQAHLTAYFRPLNDYQQHYAPPGIPADRVYELRMRLWFYRRQHEDVKAAKTYCRQYLDVEEKEMPTPIFLSAMVAAQLEKKRWLKITPNSRARLLALAAGDDVGEVYPSYAISLLLSFWLKEPNVEFPTFALRLMKTGALNAETKVLLGHGSSKEEVSLKFPYCDNLRKARFIDFTGCQFKRCHKELLKDFDFSHQSLIGSHFEDALTIEGTHFSGACLADINAQQVIFNSCYFDGADIDGFQCERTLCDAQSLKTLDACKSIASKIHARQHPGSWVVLQQRLRDFNDVYAPIVRPPSSHMAVPCIHNARWPAPSDGNWCDKAFVTTEREEVVPLLDLADGEMSLYRLSVESALYRELRHIINLSSEAQKVIPSPFEVARLKKYGSFFSQAWLRFDEESSYVLPYLKKRYPSLPESIFGEKVRSAMGAYQIQGIYCLNNPTLWQQFQEEERAVTDNIARNHSHISDSPLCYAATSLRDKLKHHHGEQHAVNWSFGGMGETAPNVINVKSGTALLFHGTSSPFVLKEIIKKGFSTDFCRKSEISVYGMTLIDNGYGAMGKGIYFADAWQKSVGYGQHCIVGCAACGQPAEDNPAAPIDKLSCCPQPVPIRALLIVEVILGRVCYSPEKTIPCKRGETVPGGFDSRWAPRKEIDAQSEFGSNEFLVSNPHRAYPSALVLYTDPRPSPVPRLIAEKPFDEEEESSEITDSLDVLKYDAPEHYRAVFEAIEDYVESKNVDDVDLQRRACCGALTALKTAMVADPPPYSEVMHRALHQILKVLFTVYDHLNSAVDADGKQTEAQWSRRVEAFHYWQDALQRGLSSDDNDKLERYVQAEYALNIFMPEVMDEPDDGNLWSAYMVKETLSWALLWLRKKEQPYQLVLDSENAGRNLWGLLERAWLLSPMSVIETLKAQMQGDALPSEILRLSFFLAGSISGHPYHPAHDACYQALYDMLSEHNITETVLETLLQSHLKGKYAQEDVDTLLRWGYNWAAWGHPGFYQLARSLTRYLIQRHDIDLQSYNTICLFDKPYPVTLPECAVYENSLALLLYIDLGAIRHCQDHLLMAWVDATAEKRRALGFGKSAVQNLESQHPRFRWRQALHQDFFHIDETSNEPAPGHFIALHGSAKNLVISQVHRDELFTNGKIKGSNKHGLRRVKELAVTEDEKIDIKVHAEYPAMEESMQLLAQWLFPNLLAPASTYLYVTKRGYVEPLLISQHIKGDTLYDCFEKHVKRSVVRKDEWDGKGLEESLSHITHSSFSEAFIFSLLTLPEDGRPPNFILRPCPTGADSLAVCLVLIDNDHNLLRDIVVNETRLKTTESILQLKSIVFCLNNMKQSLDTQVVKRFLEDTRHWQGRLEKWLQNLVHCQIECEAFVSRQNERVNNGKLLYEDGYRHYLYNTGGDKKNPVLFRYVLPNFSIVKLYERGEKLRALLQKSPDICALSLLRLILPRVGVTYEAAFRESIPPLRFSALSNKTVNATVALTTRTVVAENVTETVKNLIIGELPKALFLPREVVEAVPIDYACSPNEHLQRVQYLHLLDKKVAEAIRLLRENAPAEKALKGIDSPQTVQHFLAHPDCAWRRWPPNLRHQVSMRLFSQDLTRLSLHDHDEIEDIVLSATCLRLPNLVKLAVSNCQHTELKGRFLEVVCRYNVSVSIIKLKDLPHLHWPSRTSGFLPFLQSSLQWPNLEKLVMVRCNEAETSLVLNADNLRVLILRGMAINELICTSQYLKKLVLQNIPRSLIIDSVLLNELVNRNSLKVSVLINRSYDTVTRVGKHSLLGQLSRAGLWYSVKKVSDYDTRQQRNKLNLENCHFDYETAYALCDRVRELSLKEIALPGRALHPYFLFILLRDHPELEKVISPARYSIVSNNGKSIHNHTEKVTAITSCDNCGLLIGTATGTLRYFRIINEAFIKRGIEKEPPAHEFVWQRSYRGVIRNICMLRDEQHFLIAHGNTFSLDVVEQDARPRAFRAQAAVLISLFQHNSGLFITLDSNNHLKAWSASSLRCLDIHIFDVPTVSAITMVTGTIIVASTEKLIVCEWLGNSHQGKWAMQSVIGFSAEETIVSIHRYLYDYVLIVTLRDGEAQLCRLYMGWVENNTFVFTSYFDTKYLRDSLCAVDDYGRLITTRGKAFQIHSWSSDKNTPSKCCAPILESRESPTPGKMKVTAVDISNNLLTLGLENGEFISFKYDTRTLQLAALQAVRGNFVLSVAENDWHLIIDDTSISDEYLSEDLFAVLQSVIVLLMPQLAFTYSFANRTASLALNGANAKQCRLLLSLLTALSPTSCVVPLSVLGFSSESPEVQSLCQTELVQVAGDNLEMTRAANRSDYQESTTQILSVLSFGSHQSPSTDSPPASPYCTYYEATEGSDEEANENATSPDDTLNPQ